LAALCESVQTKRENQKNKIITHYTSLQLDVLIVLIFFAKVQLAGIEKKTATSHIKSENVIQFKVKLY
jgi:hypothetical protein